MILFLLFQRISAWSKMELFVSLINGFPSITNVTNNVDAGFIRFRLHFRFLDMAVNYVYKNVCIIMQ